MSDPAYYDSPRNAIPGPLSGQYYRFAPTFIRGRNPTGLDTKPKENQGFYPIGSFWINSSTVAEVWVLGSITSQNNAPFANWLPLVASTATGPVLTLADNAGTVISPSIDTTLPPLGPGNIQFIAGAGISIIGTTSTSNPFLTFTNTGAGTETLTGDDGLVVSPNLGTITTIGTVVANSTHAKALFTNGSVANTESWDIQLTAAIASTNVAKVGLAAFNSAQFTVDANGFTSITNFSTFNYVQTSAATYVALSTDNYISCDPTANAITIQLPNAPTNNRTFVIKDRTGKASTHNITITTVGGAKTIDGVTSYLLTGNFDSAQLIYNGSNYEVY
jgi:hypothetical protein